MNTKITSVAEFLQDKMLVKNAAIAFLLGAIIGMILTK